MPDDLAPAAFAFGGAFAVAILVILAIVLGRRHLARRLRETGEALGLSYRRRSSITGYRAAFSHVIEGEIDGVKVESFHAKLNVGYDPLINRSGPSTVYLRAGGFQSAPRNRLQSHDDGWFRRPFGPCGRRRRSHR